MFVLFSLFAVGLFFFCCCGGGFGVLCVRACVRASVCMLLLYLLLLFLWGVAGGGSFHSILARGTCM